MLTFLHKRWHHGAQVTELEMNTFVSKTIFKLIKKNTFKYLEQSSLTDLSHDGDRGFSGGLSHAVLHQVKHVLVVKQADQVEGAKAGSTAQGQISDHHGAAGREGGGQTVE